ncbi:MAG: flagellar basal-body MS-ring/collar protein FliF [Chthoniobacterales bacterium]|nr:flagellar basal-body MS-ring/collar protein FliF [Chthoniobacterales bacterium]
MKQVFHQLSIIWRELGINQKVSIILAALAVLGGLVALVVWANRPTMKLLYGGLNDKESGEIISALTEMGVPYEIGAGGRSILVPSDQVYKARMELASKGLPSNPTGIGFEIFDRSNFGVSDFVQRTNFVRALQGELARTIAQLRGVRSARVLIVLPENRLILQGDQNRPSASVFVDTGSITLDSNAVNSIRSLVANAVQGLRPQDVTVVDNQGNSLSDDLNADPLLATASSQMKFRKQIEDYLSSKVETMLAKVLGPGNAVVRVAAEINEEQAVIQEEKFDPESQVARTENIIEDNTTTNEQNQPPAQQVGVSANIPNQQQAAAGAIIPSKSSVTNRSSRTQNYEINRVTTNITRNPGSITRITAAVFLAPKPTSDGQQSTPRTAEEIAALRLMVANSLGITTRTPEELERLVSITETPFAPIVTAGISSSDSLSSFMDNLGPIAAILVAIIIFAIFFISLRKTKPEEITFELIEEEPQEQNTAQKLLPAKDHKISPELLNQLIQQKPENVGVTIRDWLANKTGT